MGSRADPTWRLRSPLDEAPVRQEVVQNFEPRRRLQVPEPHDEDELLLPRPRGERGGREDGKRIYTAALTPPQDSSSLEEEEEEEEGQGLHQNIQVLTVLTGLKVPLQPSSDVFSNSKRL